ncbi:MAG: TIM barrel protein, partial [Saonia sp.]
MTQTRRNFLGQSAMACSALFIPANEIIKSLGLEKHSPKSLKVFLFSKHLQFLNYNDMSEAAAEMGFDGLDLTVRSNGHIVPERVAEDLPKAVDAMQRFGLRTQMLTTNVTDANDTQSKLILETASKLGFQQYRMGWLKYPEDKTIPESIEAYAQQFVTLADLNKKLGLQGGYQNHAGNNVGAPVWDIYQILKGIAPEFIGCQYDIRHAVVEGGNSWELGLNLIKDYIKTIVIKDFKWGQIDGKWKPISVPLGEGMVD